MTDPLALDRALLKIAKTENELRSEEVRGQLDPQTYIEAIGEILDLSKESGADLYKLKFQSDIYLALLRKCLPDLKAIELVAPKGKPKPLKIEFVTEDGRKNAET